MSAGMAGVGTFRARIGRVLAARGPGACLVRGTFRVFCAGWRVGMAVDRLLTRTRVLPRPVISVGNIAFGGTGKTPFVMWLVRGLAARGVRAAVLTRGYRSAGAGNDEPALLGTVLPPERVLVGRDRYRAGLAHLAGIDPADVFVLDDGFQHWALARQLDMVLVDALAWSGAAGVVPAGCGREALGALRRAHVVVVTRADLVPCAVRDRLMGALEAKCPGLCVCMARERVQGWRPLVAGTPPLPAPPVLPVCGIGNPQSFFARLRAEGVAGVEGIALDDHHAWRAADAAAVEREAMRRGARAVVTTSKDATRIPATWLTLPWYVLDIATEVTSGEAALWARVEQVVR